MSKLPLSFYLQDDVVHIAKSLIGKDLCANIDNKLTTGMVVETEAYRAPEDKASHAYNNKKTPRTLPFYKKGGIAYVYIIYGVYKLFNIITNKENIPHAVLIRAIEPTKGIEIMKHRRSADTKNRLTAGPGLLSIAMGIDISHNMTNLQGNKIWLEDSGFTPAPPKIISTPRIGMKIAEPWKSIPWRFYLKDNPWVSRK